MRTLTTQESDLLLRVIYNTLFDIGKTARGEWRAILDDSIYLTESEAKLLNQLLDEHHELHGKSGRN